MGTGGHPKGRDPGRDNVPDNRGQLSDHHRPLVQQVPQDQQPSQHLHHQPGHRGFNGVRGDHDDRGALRLFRGVGVGGGGL